MIILVIFLVIGAFNAKVAGSAGLIAPTHTVTSLIWFIDILNETMYDKKKIFTDVMNLNQNSPVTFLSTEPPEEL